MKKSKILAPIMTIGTLGAIVTPMTVLTSCNKGGANTGKDADLSKDYQCEFTPAAEKTYTGATAKTDALNDYFDAITKTSNATSNGILEDDCRFSYSKAFATQSFKQYGSLSNYKLDFQNVNVDKDNMKLSCKFVANVSGSYKNASLGVDLQNGNFYCEYQLKEAFGVEFCPADSTTWENRNYIKCSLPSSKIVSYKLKGSCTFNGQYIGDIDKSNDSHTIFSSTDIYGYIADELLLDGLTCNIKVLPSQLDYGVIYTNYFANAKFA